jgi:hypothetical protein
MKKLTRVFWGLLFLATLTFTSIGIAAAQETADSVQPPPKVLVIFREYLKPGRAGTPHEKSESGFVQALTRAKWPTHYFAADSLSGRPRALFFNAYDSFADWEKDHVMMMKNPALAKELDRINVSDGDLLSDTDQTVLTFQEDQSLNAPVAIARMRGFEISVFRVRMGHRNEWSDLVKLVMGGYGKVPDIHWATYEVMYGQTDGPTYVVFSSFKSGADIDKENAQDKQFMAAMGEDGMKKLAELESSAVEASQTNLFMFNAAMSYPPENWVKADPQFWKPKAEKAMVPGKPAQKPAAK